MQMEFFHRYLQDFVSMTMNVISNVDLEVRVTLSNIHLHIIHLFMC